MNTKIMNANSARIKVKVSSEKPVQEELIKINELITSASSQGDFQALWNIPSRLNEEQLNIIMEFLADNEYTMFFKLNKRRKIVNRTKREVSTKIADIFNSKEHIIIIDWKSSREENIKNYSYFDMYNPKDSDSVAYIN